MSKENDASGMKGDRARTKSGLLRKKRDDTEGGTIEKKYNVDFGTRSDIQLKTLLKRENVHSLSKLIEKKRKG